jgi:hypothetical protein
MNNNWADHFAMVTSILIQPRWLWLEPISTVARYSPNNSGGIFLLTNISAFDTEYVFAGIGHWHGKPYRSAYFGQNSAHNSQTLP